MKKEIVVFDEEWSTDNLVIGFDGIDQIEIDAFDTDEWVMHFRAENIRAVISALEEMADWLEESPEEEVRI